MFGLRPVELTMLMVIVGFVAVDLYRTTSGQVPRKRARYGIYALAILASVITLEMVA